MGLRRRIHRLITDALTVWREAGANRPFTRRGMADGELFAAHKHSQEDEGKGRETSDRPSKAKKRHPAR